MIKEEKCNPLKQGLKYYSKKDGKMKNRTSLFDFKQRMRKNVWSVDEYDLPMIVEWLLEVDDSKEKIEVDYGVEK